MRLFVLLLSFLCLTSLQAEKPEDVVRQALIDVEEGRIGRGNLESLQISPFCLDSKKEKIGIAWEDLGHALRQNLWRAEIEKKKLSGDLAAVSVALHGPVAPDEARLIVFALRQIDNHWKIAPVFGSFENAGLSFESERMKQRQELEDWMALERGAGLDRIIIEAEKNFESELKSALSDEVRNQATPDEMVEKFLQAARAGRAKEMLRWLGYPEQLDGEEKRRIIRVISRGLRGEDEQRQWWMLHSSDGLTVKLGSQSEGNEGHVVVGFYNPVIQAGQQMQAHRFLVERPNKKAPWRLILPGNFSHADEPSHEYWRARNHDVATVDRQLLPHMAAILAEEGHKKRTSTPAKALEEIMAALRTESLSALVPYFVWEEEESLRDRRIALQQIGVFWQDYRQNSDPEVAKIDLWRKEDHALGILRLSSEKNYPDISLASIRLRKDDQGWGMMVSHRNFVNKTEQALLKRYAQEIEDIKNKILYENFNDLLTVYKNDHGKVSENQARQLLTKYGEALQSQKLGNVLSLCAILDSKTSFSDHLTQASNSMRSALSQKENEAILPSEISLHGQWAAGSVSLRSGAYAETGYPVILVVPTEKGPRVLLDADLWVETSKAKRLRNIAATRNLGKKLTPEKLAEMKILVAAQQEKMTRVLEARKPADEK